MKQHVALPLPLPLLLQAPSYHIPLRHDNQICTELTENKDHDSNEDGEQVEHE